jgi:hypothetical protein
MGQPDMSEPDMEQPDMEPSDKPFDDKEPFDAGVEANEETDPKKFIEQLSGKIGQSLRKFTETQGQPDFELEKFAIIHYYRQLILLRWITIKTIL